MPTNAATLGARYWSAMPPKSEGGEVARSPLRRRCPLRSLQSIQTISAKPPPQKRRTRTKKSSPPFVSLCIFALFLVVDETAMPAKDIRRYIIMSNEGFLSDLLTATEL